MRDHNRVVKMVRYNGHPIQNEQEMTGKLFKNEIASDTPVPLSLSNNLKYVRPHSSFRSRMNTPLSPLPSPYMPASSITWRQNT